MDGKLIIGTGHVQLREGVQDVLDGGARKILINVQQVTMIDSSGLGELIRTKATASSRDATLKLLHVEGKVQEILEMTHLIGVFETFNDEIDAIASFR